MVKGPAVSPQGRHEEEREPSPEDFDGELINETEISTVPAVQRLKKVTASSYQKMATESPGVNNQVEVDHCVNKLLAQNEQEVDQDGQVEVVSENCVVEVVLVGSSKNSALNIGGKCERAAEDVSQDSVKLEEKVPIMMQTNQQLVHPQQGIPGSNNGGNAYKTTNLLAVPPNQAIAVVQPTYYKVQTIPKQRPAVPSGIHYMNQLPPPQQPPKSHQKQQQPVHHHHHHHRIMAQIPMAQPLLHHPTTTSTTVTGIPQSGGGVTSVPTATTTTTIWPVVDPVFHFGPGFEPPTRNYCPKHEPQPQEHVVFFHVHPGVSVTFQIAGSREIVRGKSQFNEHFYKVG